MMSIADVQEDDVDDDSAREGDVLSHEISHGSMSVMAIREWLGDWWLAMTVALVTSGCAQIPQKDFSNYREAFNQTNQVAQEVVLDYEAARKEFCSRAAEIGPAALVKVESACGTPSAETLKKDEKKKTSPLPYPKVYMSSAVQRSAATPQSVQVRLSALAVIARYNEVLTDLAEGKSVDEVSTAAKSVVSAVESFTQPIPGLGAFASTLLAAAEKVRSRQEFVKAVKAGERPVSQILTFLADDSNDYYNLRWLLAEYERSVLLERLSNRVKAMETAVGAHTAEDPGGGETEAIRSSINAQLEAIGGSLIGRPAGIVFTPAASGPAWDPVTETQLKADADLIKEDVGQYQSLVGRVNTYYTLLQKYEKLLADTKQGMISLRLAIDAPADVVAQFDELFQTALSVRADFIKLRTNL